MISKKCMFLTRAKRGGWTHQCHRMKIFVATKTNIHIKKEESMKTFSLIIVFLAIVLLVGVGFAQEQKEPSEDLAGKLQKIQKAIEENGANWTAGMNDIFMLSAEEKRQLCGLLDSISLERIPDSEQVMRYAWHPEKFNWHNLDRQNWITPVKDQGRCGSCVAFSTIGTFEGQYNIYHNLPVEFYAQNNNCDFSEQHFLSCGDGTCDGWYLDDAFQYLLEAGVPDEACFPYVSGEDDIDRPCSDGCSDWQERAAYISCWGSVGGHSGVRTPAEIKEQLLKGPVATGFTVFDDFQAYTGGIYEHVYSEEDPGYHAVVFVGWDDTTDPPCWICKNSWDTDWGEGGYFRIRMGTNEVGIESLCFYLTMGDVPEGELSDNGHLYGNVDVGDTEDWELKIANIGAADLEIYGFSADTASSAFYVTPPYDYPQTIVPGDTLPYVVTFAPDTVGFQYVRMNVLSNSCRMLPDLKLRGTGLIHNVKADPKAIEETVDQGDVQTVPVTIIYKGDSTLTYIVEVLRDWLSVEPDSGIIEAGGSAEFTVTFDASILEPGEHRTNILIKTDDPTDRVVVVPVTLFVMEAAGIAVTLPPTVNPIDQIIDLDLCIDNKNTIEMPITEVFMQINFQATLLQLQDIAPTSRIESMSTFQWNEAEPGEVTLAISDGNGNIIAPGTEPVARLAFAFQEGTACGDSAWIDVTEVALTDTLGTLLEARVSDGLVVALCKGDVDANGAVEIADVLQAVQYILEKSCAEEWTMECWATDYNDDGTIDALDLVGMINVILGQ